MGIAAAACRHGPAGSSPGPGRPPALRMGTAGARRGRAARRRDPGRPPPLCRRAPTGRAPHRGRLGAPFGNSVRHEEGDSALALPPVQVALGQWPVSLIVP